MRGFLLDTVTVSELRKGTRADRNVIEWQLSVKNEDEESWLSVVTLLEIRVGLQRVAPRDADFARRLEVWYQDRLLPRFQNLILPVDKPVAEAAAEITVVYGLSPYDAIIAGTARVHDLILATRNVSDFRHTAIKVVNPWNPQ